MKSRTRELKLEILKMEIDGFNKIISSLDSLEQAAGECRNILEDFHNSLSPISWVPRKYEAVDKASDALDVVFRASAHAEEARDMLKELMKEYEELIKEENSERRNQVAGSESSSESN